MKATVGITQTKVTYHWHGELGSPPFQNLQSCGFIVVRAVGLKAMLCCDRPRAVTRGQRKISKGAGQD